jgi:argininosuccinate lyase
MMPQKRNPDPLELIRAKTGTVYGSLMAMLTVLKAQPLTYNRDLQEDKRHVFATADTVSISLDMAREIISGAKFNTDKIAAGIEQGFLDATALAEYLVRKGLPFREAHGIVGSLVAHCEKENKKLAELDLDGLKRFCPSIESDVYDNLGAAKLTDKYVTAGAAGPSQAREQIAYWTKQLDQR